MYHQQLEKMAQTIKNPFPVNAYIGDDYFCDRENELKFITENIQNGNSITMMAIRRIGKTGLIKHFMEHKPNDIEVVYLDILDTENLNQLLNKLTSSILSQFKEKTGIGKKIWKFIQSLRPTINFDPLTGMPQASFMVNQEETETNIESVFQFLERQDLIFVIAIDEFQQILQYPENHVDSWLRTHIQTLKNIRFIFSGSQQHLMTELFATPGRPFFRSTSFLRLTKIDKQVYSKFIQNQFGKYGRQISPEVSLQILTWTETHTYYVQQLCNRLFATGKKVVTEKEWRIQASQLIKEQEILFFSFRSMLSKNQWALLKAIAGEGAVYQLTSHDFINKYNLSSSATILKALTRLIDTGLVYKDYNADGEAYYSVYDVFFKRWSESFKS